MLDLAAKCPKADNKNNNDHFCKFNSTFTFCFLRPLFLNFKHTWINTQLNYIEFHKLAGQLVLFPGLNPLIHKGAHAFPNRGIKHHLCFRDWLGL